MNRNIRGTLETAANICNVNNAPRAWILEPSLFLIPGVTYLGGGNGEPLLAGFLSWPPLLLVRLLPANSLRFFAVQIITEHTVFQTLRLLTLLQTFQRSICSVYFLRFSWIIQWVGRVFLPAVFKRFIFVYNSSLEVAIDRNVCWK